MTEQTEIEPVEIAPVEGISKKDLEILSDLVKAGRGELSDIANEILRQFVNLKHNQERTMFPSVPYVIQDTFLRLFTLFYPDIAKPGEQWADQLATALIGYKGYGGERAVDMVKAQAGNIQPPGTNISFMGQPQQQPKKGLFRRGEKKEKSEFENE